MKITPIIYETDDRWKRQILEIDDIISVIWTDRYYSPGDFELVVPASPKNIAAIKKGYLVGILRDRQIEQKAAIIEKVERSADEEGHRRIIASGRFLGAYLYRRIISNQAICTNMTLWGIVSKLATENAINDTVRTDRNFGNIGLSASSDEGPTIESAQFTGQNLGAQISELCEAYKMGWRMKKVGAIYTVEMYQGIDRTTSQSTNQPAVFSDEDGSLQSITYSENDSDRVTSAKVAGEGQGTARKTAWLEYGYTIPAGYERYEAYVDARDLSTNDGEIDIEEYKKMMAARGREVIRDTEHILEASATFGPMKYGADVGLGDLCTIRSTALGLEIDARLVEVIESIDETGRYSAIPTFAI